VPLFRKKPVLVKAEQWFPGREVEGVCRHAGADTRYYVFTADGQGAYLEPGDYVVAEPEGRGHYPVKPDIFEASHDPA
jgi:hypothetical protein